MKHTNTEFFNTSLLKRFREVINSSNIFHTIPEYKCLWNLICVVMDRLDSSVKYLNAHIDHPTSEDDLILFLVHATIIKDGIYKLHENVYKTKPNTIDSRKWFKEARDIKGPIFNKENCPTDDVFFEYLRAMAFAHPFEVSKRGRPFIEQNEIQCSPWVFTHSVLPWEEDAIGLRVYTNKRDETQSIFIQFKNLKEYLKERYLLLEVFIKWGLEKISQQNKKWMKTKVERGKGALITLSNICEIMDERYVSHYAIDDAIAILRTQFDSEPNISVVNHVKDMITQKIPSICDCVDTLNYAEIDNLLNFLYERPSGLHNHAHYELEKIFDYLEDERGDCLPGSDEEWGLIQAVNFYNAYANRFVAIDFQKMSYLEIKILIRSALIIGREREDSISKSI